MVGQEGGPPSLFNTIDSSEYPWLSYYCLLAEEQFEEQEGVWISLLKLLKKDQKISIDNALKKALSDLGHTGSSFNVNHLCIYRWADLCSSMDTSFILYPLVWQRYFTLYLQRPIFTASMPERGSLGLRFFSTNRTQGIRRNMRKALTKSFRSLQEELKSIKRDNEEEKGNIFLLELLPKLISYYQMLQMWLEEPRLHEETLSLPSLPIQYEPERLSKLFKTQQSDWVEFLRLWEIEDIIKVMLDEWKQVQLYQKALSCQTESHEQSPDTAAARIEKRLRYRSTPAPPPPFISPPAPFSLVPTRILLSKPDLLSAVVADINFIAQQGSSYCERYNSMVALDSEYMSGIPDLYSNQPRQFHVSIPCHKKAACTGSATIVFRFNELTPHPHWEQRVPQNRQEHKELLSALSCPVSFDLCKAVARTEHVVGELSKLSESNDSEALSNGVSLFYEVLKFITSETKQYPPTCQFLSSCIQILGQEFIHRDPSQTATILQLLLAQRSLGDILAPLFDPNLCPPDFISMYVSVREVAIKEGPTIAFSTLTKFNIPKWLSDYSPSLPDSSQLLKYIFQGISYCGREPDDDLLILLEGYLSHFSKLLEYQFPLLYNEALHLVIDGTDTGGISPRCWEELSKVTTPSLSTEYDSCRLGLQLLQESLQHLSNFYTQKRFYTKETIYELVTSDYVSHILQFIVMLCTSLINKLLTSVELENNTIQGALTEAWRSIIDAFRAWILPLLNGENNEVTFPCKLERIITFDESFRLFVQLVSLLQSKFANSESGSPLHLLWFFYCNELSLPATPLHILECYHTHLTSLPWEQYAPDLSAMDLMIKLKINKEVSQMCFVFLGGIFPSFNWKEIAKQYSSDLSLSVHFHITFLQLLVMLAAEPEIMNNKDSHVPQLISDAKSFDFHYIDLKTYQDILEWQKNNCTPSSILQAGSSLSLALRLLKAAGSFPLNSTSKPLTLHKDGWDKRYSYMRMLVEIISTSSQHKETHTSSYSDIVSFMMHTLIDTVVFEPESLSTMNPVILLQEMINMFNTCHPSDQFISNLISHVTDCLDQLPNASRLHLPTITAASRTIVSIPLMVKLVEIVITVYFKHYPPVKETTLQLPAKMDGYGWTHLSSSLSIPDTAAHEFYTVCVQQFACYCLNTRLLNQLQRCSSLEEELEILTKMVQSCSSLKPKPNEEHKMFVIWDKILNLSLRQISFGNINPAINQFTSLANTLQRFGEDKATEGLLGAIGLGKKSIYSLEFRLISRVLATFIHTQLPLDTSQSVHPRLSPGAPGHIKDPMRYVTGFASVAMATKQADQASASLESLLSNKSYLHLRDYISYSLDMINDLQCNLMNIQQLFVYLVINLYSSERSLDSLRVAQT
ncbi:PREDICTED: ectopic P granules protein 5 homolog [Amphimedon queenslandica]|uniref:Uncharacterized protein n=1 Tax=Amphimedon queenslandica TaxID=400682 RepID=A0AAN0JGY7_AMPQE|nr:PREDICTED: ectopic P granules protein 5 homolog [Amphimedon queenslandica]|eukprot:XP_019856290.1 PREDICTED: ectopic P granules protein 5 homolog [Amphimedon queenslandica]